MNALEPYLLGFLAGLEPDPELTVSQWSDANRHLSSKAAAEPGQWRTERTPYLREIMDSLSVYDPIQRVVFKKSAQIGGTEAGNNWIGYVAMHAPGPMLYVVPTVDIAKKVAKQRIAPLIEESPALTALFPPARARDSGNTLLVKEYRGGVFMLTGANSAAGLRSMPIRFLFLDEIDAYPGDVEGEGDPIDLAEKRTTTFTRRKVFLVSTPTVKDASKIDKEWERSDKRRYHVACPHCGNMQWLRWRGFNDDPEDPRAKEYRLRWLDEGKTAAGYLCEADDCGALIEERFKTEMLRDREAGGVAEWRPTAEGDGITRGYHLSSLYSPIGWKSWVEILQEFEASAKDPAKLKTFVNTTLGETFEEAYSIRLDAEGLAKRAGMHWRYSLLTVPEPAVVVTAGVDVQRNRLHVLQRAWGPGDESWLVNRAVLFGDPYRDELWDQLLNLLNTPIEHASGARLVTYAACIDSGDGETTHEVYAFTRANRQRHLLATKGLPGGKPVLGAPTKQDIDRRGQKIKGGAALYPIGVDSIKSMIHGRLRNTEPGSGTYHWPQGLDEDYWKQLTAERQKVVMVNGFPRRVWVKSNSDRNEDLDCEVMNVAALEYIKTRHNRATMYEQLREQLTATASRMAAQSAAMAQSDPDAPPPAPPVVVQHSAGRISLGGARRFGG